MLLDLVHAVAEVLQLPRRRVDLQRFEEDLGRIEQIPVMVALRLREDVLVPEGESSLDLLVRQNQLLDALLNNLLQFLYRLILSLRNELGHSGREIQQMKERCQRR